MRTRSSASRTGASSGSSSARSGKAGAWPAASSSWLRSRNGTSSCSASSSTISALGVERPVSTKLRCRAEMPASSARSSCVRRRRLRHSRSSGPTRGWELTVAISWWPTLAATRPPLDYLRGNRQDDPPMRSSAHDESNKSALPSNGRALRFSPWPSPACSASSPSSAFSSPTTASIQASSGDQILSSTIAALSFADLMMCAVVFFAWLPREAARVGIRRWWPFALAALGRPLLRVSPLPLLPRTETDRGRHSSATATAFRGRDRGLSAELSSAATRP